MESELYFYCELMINLLENLLLQNKITLDEFEKEFRLKRIFIEEINTKHKILQYPHN